MASFNTRTRMRALLLAGGLAAALTASLVGCAGSGSGDPAPSTDANSAETPAEPSETVTVYAAASLKAAFDEIAEAFEAENENIDIAPITYDGSQVLATQIIEGAPADVFASADEANMQKVVDAGFAQSPAVFATNTLVVVLPAGNPGQVESLADLAGVMTVLCVSTAPCGAASDQLLANAGVEVTPVSREQNVTAVRTKIEESEADAGLVYATDVIGNDAVESFAPEGADQVVNSYPVVALDEAPSPAGAKAFVAFVLGEQGQAILAKYGFGKA